MPISSVSMELICVFQSEVCKTTQETRTHRDSDGRTHHTTETVYHYYPYTLELLHTPRADIFDSRSIGGTVFTSPASIPFAVQMPINMPSTLETEGLRYPIKVAYFLLVYAFSMQGQICCTRRHEVYVYSVFPYVGPEKPLLSFRTYSSHFCCFLKNLTTFMCTTDKTVYVPGEPIKLTYWIQTDRPETVPEFHSISARLNLLTTCSMPAALLDQPIAVGNQGAWIHGKPRAIDHKRRVGEFKLLPPNLGTTSSASITWPSTCGPPCLEPGAPLTWSYVMTVKVVLNRIFDSTYNLEIPIVFNGKNAEQLIQSNTPLTYPMLPDAVAAHQLYLQRIRSAPAPSAEVPVVAEVCAIELPAVDSSVFPTVEYVSVPTA